VITRSTILAVLLGLTTACGTEGAAGPSLPTCQVGRARFVNLIADAARNPVNAILENVPWGVNLGYTGTTPASLPAPSTALYSSVCVGTRTLALVHTPNPSVTHATLNFTMGQGEDRTVFAVATGTAPITAFTTTDDNAAPAAGQTRVRVVNMSPAVGAIDVFLTTGTNADLGAATPAATNIAHQSASAYLNVAPGTYQFRAVPAGTAPASRNASVVANTTGIALAAGSGRTIIVANNTAASPTLPAIAFVLSDR
jgi:Domain of unknown function (DUF4397)